MVQGWVRPQPHPPAVRGLTRAAAAWLVAVFVAVTAGPVAASAPPGAPGCDLAPLGSYWSADVRALPVHLESDAFLTTIGRDRDVHPDFGSGLWEGGPIGIPYTTVDADQSDVAVTFVYADESDPGPYPIPTDAPIEGGPDADGDRHVLVINRDTCVLSELYAAYPRSDGRWDAGSGAVFDLKGHDLRPAGWTSADAAGLPILTGLGPQARVVATALKTHGGIVADNGSAWYLSGVPDEQWDNDDLRTLRTLDGNVFEVVDASSLRADNDRSATITLPARSFGDDRITTAAELARAAFPEGSGTAVLANAFVAADALAAGPLAAAHTAPLLAHGP